MDEDMLFLLPAGLPSSNLLKRHPTQYHPQLITGDDTQATLITPIEEGGVDRNVSESFHEESPENMGLVKLPA